jgi:chromosome partitioning protein
MSNIIAICNQKGGVGKTTSCFNLGAALSLKHGKKVLLVDLDPQANLSEYLCFAGDEKPTMTQLTSEVARSSVISPERVTNAIRYNERNKLYYLPADINLANAETIMATALARETILKRILSDEVVSQFDYVLIDCLPSLGILLINALTAANGMIIPVQTQKFSMDGLTALNSLYSQIRSTINPTLTLTGVLPTMTDNTNVSKNALRTLSAEYDSVFRTVIHKSVEAAKSSESGNALCRTKNRLGEEYLALSEEVIALCG